MARVKSAHAGHFHVMRATSVPHKNGPRGTPVSVKMAHMGHFKFTIFHQIDMPGTEAENEPSSLSDFHEICSVEPSQACDLVADSQHFCFFWVKNITLVVHVNLLRKVFLIYIFENVREWCPLSADILEKLWVIQVSNMEINIPSCMYSFQMTPSRVSVNLDSVCQDGIPHMGT